MRRPLASRFTSMANRSLCGAAAQAFTVASWCPPASTKECTVCGEALTARSLRPSYGWRVDARLVVTWSRGESGEGHLISPRGRSAASPSCPSHRPRYLLAMPNLAPLIVIDLQTNMFDGRVEPPIHDAPGIAERTRSLIDWARRSGRKIAFVRHDGPAGDPLAPGEPGW